MLSRVRVLLALLSSLLVMAAPAMAQEPAATVGAGQVVTDQAAQTETETDSGVPYADDGQPAPEPAPDASGRRGEIHVLDATTSSRAPSKAAVPAPARAAAAPAQQARPAATTTLPFTGIDAGALALIGLALLAAGSGLLAVLRQPVQ